jgi:hypothetical protein
MTLPAEDLEDHGLSPELVARAVALIIAVERNTAARAAARASQPNDLAEAA